MKSDKLYLHCSRPQSRVFARIPGRHIPWFRNSTSAGRGAAPRWLSDRTSDSSTSLGASNATAQDKNRTYRRVLEGPNGEKLVQRFTIEEGEEGIGTRVFDSGGVTPKWNLDHASDSSTTSEALNATSKGTTQLRVFKGPFGREFVVECDIDSPPEHPWGIAPTPKGLDERLSKTSRRSIPRSRDELKPGQTRNIVRKVITSTPAKNNKIKDRTMAGIQASGTQAPQLQLPAQPEQTSPLSIPIPHRTTTFAPPILPSDEARLPKTPAPTGTAASLEQQIKPTSLTLPAVMSESPDISPPNALRRLEATEVSGVKSPRSENTTIFTSAEQSPATKPAPATIESRTGPTRPEQVTQTGGSGSEAPKAAQPQQEEVYRDVKQLNDYLELWKDEEAQPTEVDERPKWEDLEPWTPSDQIHVLGQNLLGRYITHVLAGNHTIPPPCYLIPHYHLARALVEAEGQLAVHCGGEVDIRNRFTGELVTRNKQPRDEDEIIRNLIVTVPAGHVVEALKPLIHRLDHRSTICLIQDGLGIAEEIVEAYYPYDYCRPVFLLGQMTTALGYTKSRFDLKLVRPGKLHLTMWAAPFYLQKEEREQAARIVHHPPKERQTRAMHFIRLLTAIPELNATGHKMEHWLDQKLPVVTFHAVVDPVATLLDSPYDRIVKNRYAKKMIEKMLDEVAEVMRRMPEYRLNQRYRTYLTKLALRKDVLHQLMRKRQADSPMRPKVERGINSDINYVTGYFVKRGDQLGVKVPTLKSIALAIKSRQVIKADLNRRAIPFEKEYDLQSQKDDGDFYQAHFQELKWDYERRLERRRPPPVPSGVDERADSSGFSPGELMNAAMEEDKALQLQLEKMDVEDENGDVPFETSSQEALVDDAKQNNSPDPFDGLLGAQEEGKAAQAPVKGAGAGF